MLRPRAQARRGGQVADRDPAGQGGREVPGRRGHDVAGGRGREVDDLGVPGLAGQQSGHDPGRPAGGLRGQLDLDCPDLAGLGPAGAVRPVDLGVRDMRDAGAGREGGADAPLRMPPRLRLGVDGRFLEPQASGQDRADVGEARQRRRAGVVAPAGRGHPGGGEPAPHGAGPETAAGRKAGGAPAGHDRAGPRGRRGHRGRQQVVGGGVVLREEQQAGDVAFGEPDLPGVGSARSGQRCGFGGHGDLFPCSREAGEVTPAARGCGHAGTPAWPAGSEGRLPIPYGRCRTTDRSNPRVLLLPHH